MENIKNFEKEKEEYLEELSKNELIKNTTITSYRDKGMLKEEKMFLNPQNETELKFAKSVLYSSIDTTNLIACLSTGEIELMPVKENEAISDFIKVAKCLNAKETIDETIFGDKTPEKKARVFFGFLVLYISDSYEYWEYIYNQVGLDQTSQTDRLKMKKYTAIFMKISNSIKNSLDSKIDYPDSDEGIDNVYRFSMEFRELSKKYTKKSYSYGEMVTIIAGLSKLSLGR